MRRLALKIIDIYRKTKQYRGAMHCRFYPSCSDYAYEAVEKFGLIKGIFLAAMRLGRCNQFFPGGFDPVP